VPLLPLARLARSAPAAAACATTVAVALAGLPATATASTAVTATVRRAAVVAQGFAWPAGSGTTYADAGAAGGTARLTWSNGTGTGTVSTAGPSSALVVRARGDQCAGAPSMVVAVDGRSAGTVAVSATTWTSYRVPVVAAAGSHTVALTFPNDFQGYGCDRNLRLDDVSFAATAPSAPGNPLAGAPLWVDPGSDAARTAASLRSSDPVGAALVDKIAGAPSVEYFGDWVPTASVQSVVAGRMAAAGSAVPELVVYAIPHRDCGSYSSGGLSGASAYHDWVSRFAAGIGGHRAVVVVEPDALAQLDCLSAADQSARTAMLRDAVALLTASPATTVYLDGGNSTWKSVADMTTRLRAAGVGLARGFSLNVANFNPTAGELAYGDQISAALGGAHFVVDTSRNGRGPAPTWCNPPGQGLGARPTSVTGDSRADAFLWLKMVGQSDGTCNGGPAAGTWWPDYARGLASRAAW
jgi:endoglucanase